MAPFLLLFLLSALLRPTSPSSLPSQGLRLDLTYVPPVASLEEASAVGVADRTKIPIHPNALKWEYNMDFSVGTPPVPVTAAVDTGSNLVWTQCKPCKSSCFKQPTPLFDPKFSKTFSYLPCSDPFCPQSLDAACSPHCTYFSGYGDGTATQGSLATETLTLAPGVSVSGFVFGCSDDTSTPSPTTEEGWGTSGIVGLGRGRLSMVTQLGLTKFSYCLGSRNNSGKSPLLFGSMAGLRDPKKGRSTPLLQNPFHPSLYYVNLQGITVGDTRVKLPSTFEMKEDGSGGIVVDSGSSLTVLELDKLEAVEEALVKELQRAAGGRVVVVPKAKAENPLCFILPEDMVLAGQGGVEMPRLVMHFEGADLEVTEENYLTRVDPSTRCLMVLGTKKARSIWGNNQQQNLHVVFDLEGEMLSFAPEDCGRL